ncbi:putative RNA recognition motif domain, nucleotide-binding alpha-beta plait domain superfamily [Helianthus annuus]|nr:putative RNA recognition motif domain, nucleotide-binding alpha-beta plait domain superfamily [Helianthus annuus]
MMEANVWKFLLVGWPGRSVTEDKVHKIFSTYGEIMDIRLIKDQNGSLKGFGFVRFTTKDAADKALKELNESMPYVSARREKDWCSPISWSRYTSLGNLNKGWSADDFSNVVCQVFPDVSIDLAQPSGSETISKKFKNHGFGFVKFSSHAVSCSTRSRALKVGAKPNFVLGGTLHPSVKWAEEDAGVDTQELAKHLNLPSTADENYLKLLFGPFGKVGCVQGWSHTLSVKTKPFCQFVQIYPIEQWIDCSSFEIDAHIRGWLYPRLRFGSYIKRAEKSSIAGLKRGFDALNSYLASHTFLVGDGVTLVEEEEARKPKLNNPLDLLPPRVVEGATYFIRVPAKATIFEELEKTFEVLIG